MRRRVQTFALYYTPHHLSILTVVWRWRCTSTPVLHHPFYSLTWSLNIWNTWRWVRQSKRFKRIQMGQCQLSLYSCSQIMIDKCFAVLTFCTLLPNMNWPNVPPNVFGSNAWRNVLMAHSKHWTWTTFGLTLVIIPSVYITLWMYEGIWLNTDSTGIWHLLPVNVITFLQTTVSLCSN